VVEKICDNKNNAAEKSLAIMRIAKMYEMSLGVEKNKKLAKEWRNK
jgi:TPR repeat protein